MTIWRSDVVGSLLRPDYLKAAGDRQDHADITPAEFKRIEDRAVDEAVALQEAAGLEVRHRRRDAPLRVLRPPGRSPRRVRPAGSAGRLPSATTKATTPRCAARSSWTS